MNKYTNIQICCINTTIEMSPSLTGVTKQDIWVSYMGVRARGLGGLQPPDSGKPIIFRAEGNSQK